MAEISSLTFEKHIPYLLVQSLVTRKFLPASNSFFFCHGLGILVLTQHSRRNLLQNGKRVGVGTGNILGSDATLTN